MKVRRMGITEILRRIWLFSANKIKSTESISKLPTQLIVQLNSSLWHIIVTFISTLKFKTTICVNSEPVKPSCLEAWHNGSIRFCNFTYMFKGFSSSDCRDFTFVFSWSKSFWSCNTSFFISSIFCAVFCKLASSCLSLLTSILKTRTSSSLSRKIASPKIWYT